jgi:exodeoxyribonuclease VII large subunit
MQEEIPILTVSQLTYAIKSQLEPTFRNLYIRGEVSNFRKQSSGHLYFSLIEGGCQLSAVIFRTSALQLQSPLKDGDTILAEGELNVYPPKGSYQIIVRKVSHIGLGAALLRLQELKRTLQARGWFAQERKRPLPKEIRTIGIVTSPTGAVLQDIINVLSRRLGTFHLIVNPVKVQGEGAAQEIAKAIYEFNKYKIADVIIVCRGGGSAEDLSAFNEEIVAKACFESNIPLISAVGHETDLSITDLVADIRAPTPSAAAEIVSKERSEIQQRLGMLFTAITRLVHTSLRNSMSKISLFQKRLNLQIPQAKIEELLLRLDDIEQSIQQAFQQQYMFRKQLLARTQIAVSQQAPLSKLAHQKGELQKIISSLSKVWQHMHFQRSEALKQTSSLLIPLIQKLLLIRKKEISEERWLSPLKALISQQLANLKNRLKDIQSHFHALHPQRTLERGYAIIFRKNSTTVVRSVQTISKNDELSIMVSDGKFEAKVCEVKNT